MSQKISSYYDFHTRLSRRLKISRFQVRHRPLYIDGTEELKEADEVSANLVYGFLRGYVQDQQLAWRDLHVCDFGAGSGETLLALADKIPDTLFTGVTNSALQHRLAEESVMGPSKFPMRKRLEFICGDFSQVAFSQPFDVIYSIESFIHSSSPEDFLAHAAQYLKPGGLLILIDDFLAQAPSHAKLKLKLARYRQHRMAGSLVSIEQVRDKAKTFGFRLDKTKDLTPYLKNWQTKRSAPGFLLSWLGLAAPKHPLVSGILGLDALNALVKEGVLNYRLIVLSKQL